MSTMLATNLQYSAPTPILCRLGCNESITFSRVYERNRHEREQHNGTLHYCPVIDCFYTTKRPSRLGEHVAKKHPSIGLLQSISCLFIDSDIERRWYNLGYNSANGRRTGPGGSGSASQQVSILAQGQASVQFNQEMNTNSAQLEALVLQNNLRTRSGFSPASAYGFQPHRDALHSTIQSPSRPSPSTFRVQALASPIYLGGAYTHLAGPGQATTPPFNTDSSAAQTSSRLAVQALPMSYRPVTAQWTRAGSVNAMDELGKEPEGGANEEYLPWNVRGRY